MKKLCTNLEHVFRKKLNFYTTVNRTIGNGTGDQILISSSLESDTLPLRHFGVNFQKKQKPKQLLNLYEPGCNPAMNQSASANFPRRRRQWRIHGILDASLWRIVMFELYYHQAATNLQRIVIASISTETPKQIEIKLDSTTASLSPA